MIIKNTEAGRIVQRVAATMAIEDMYVSKEFIEKLLKVSKNRKIILNQNIHMMKKKDEGN